MMGETKVDGVEQHMLHTHFQHLVVAGYLMLLSEPLLETMDTPAPKGIEELIATPNNRNQDTK